MEEGCGRRGMEEVGRKDSNHDKTNMLRQSGEK